MRFIMKKTLLVSGLLLASQSFAGQSLDAIKSKGVLTCGVTAGLPGFSVPDENNNWKGLDVDFCKGLAVAIFNDASKVKYQPLTSKQRFSALQSGEVDVLARVTTETLSRDGLGIDFIGVNFYDGQGFMVPKSLGVTSAKELDGASLCSNTGTTTEVNMNDYFKANGMTFKPVIFESSDEVLAAYEAGRCDVYSSDTSGLYIQRSKMANAADHVILPEVISKEPLAIAVREGDDKFADIARWTLNCTINAEELGVTKANVGEMKNSKDPKVMRLLGVDTDLGSKSLGVDDAWCANIIAATGNYGEIFAENLGEKSPLKIERGLNNLWNKGGILYAAPVR